MLTDPLEISDDGFEKGSDIVDEALFLETRIIDGIGGDVLLRGFVHKQDFETMYFRTLVFQRENFDFLAAQ